MRAVGILGITAAMLFAVTGTAVAQSHTTGWNPMTFKKPPDGGAQAEAHVRAVSR